MESSPANIKITTDDEVKVLDFGIARAVSTAELNAPDATVFDAGRLGALTPAYASPEMHINLDPDFRDDVYGLACVTYELLTGRHPFGGLPATAAPSRVRVVRPATVCGESAWHSKQPR